MQRTTVVKRCATTHLHHAQQMEEEPSLSAASPRRPMVLVLGRHEQQALILPRQEQQALIRPRHKQLARSAPDVHCASFKTTSTATVTATATSQPSPTRLRRQLGAVTIPHVCADRTCGRKCNIDKERGHTKICHLAAKKHVCATTIVKMSGNELPLHTNAPLRIISDVTQHNPRVPNTSRLPR